MKTFTVRKISHKNVSVKASKIMYTIYMKTFSLTYVTNSHYWDWHWRWTHENKWFYSICLKVNNIISLFRNTFFLKKLLKLLIKDEFCYFKTHLLYLYYKSVICFKNSTCIGWSNKLRVSCKISFFDLGFRFDIFAFSFIYFFLW